MSRGENRELGIFSSYISFCRCLELFSVIRERYVTFDHISEKSAFFQSFVSSSLTTKRLSCSCWLCYSIQSRRTRSDKCEAVTRLVEGTWSQNPVGLKRCRLQRGVTAAAPRGTDVTQTCWALIVKEPSWRKSSWLSSPAASDWAGICIY